ncbi:hypothetical protein HMPREF3191_01024 [Veillonellaceae bacterium DNF00626]|nr:hypothetical protein HMPREF3191_01024 [Veillonellaceae bacterium DNF00626]
MKGEIDFGYFSIKQNQSTLFYLYRKKSQSVCNQGDGAFCLKCFK